MGIRSLIRKISPILLIAFMVSACAKKNWNCNCTVNGSDYSMVIENTTKPKAGSACSKYGKKIGSKSAVYTSKCKVNS